MLTMKKLMFTLIGLSSVIAPIAQAKEVKVIFGLALRPYIIKEDNSGFELDIFREALALKGHTLKPIYSAFTMIPLQLRDGTAEAAQRGAPELVDGKGFYYASEPTVVYQDNAYSLKKSNLQINSLADLKGKSIGAFQGATKFLGPDFAAAVNGNPNYQEAANSNSQYTSLYAGQLQVVIGDINIFKYFKTTRKALTDSEEIVVHKIFANTQLKTNNAVFLDKQIRDDFEQGIKQLKASGKYQQIIKKYIND